MRRILFLILCFSTVKTYSQTFDQLNQMALKAGQEKKYNQAIALYNKALKLDNGNYFIYNQLSKLYYKKNNIDSSIIYCDSTLAIAPNDTTALYQRGYNYMDEGQFSKGGNDFMEVFLLKNKKNADAAFNLGKCYAGLKNYDKAIETYLLTLQIEPNDKYSFYELGLCYASLADTKNALKYYSKAIDQDQNYFSPYFGRALLYAAQIKDFNKAHHDFERSMEIRPKYKDSYIYNARLYSQEQEFGKAKDLLNALITIYPDDGDGYLERALVWYNIGVLNMVCKDLDKAQQLGNTGALEYKKKWCK